MPDTPIHSTKPYWEERVKKALAINDLKEMIFVDARFDAYTERVKRQLSLWHNGYSVLDVACGYGRFSDGFDQYLGLDFCEGMIKLAQEKYPQREFKLVPDAKNIKLGRKFDVVFEVNSLKSLNMSANEFFDHFGKYANKYIAVLEVDEFIIKQIYEHKRSV